MPGGGVTAAVSRRFCALANAPKMRTNHELALQLLGQMGARRGPAAGSCLTDCEGARTAGGAVAGRTGAPTDTVRARRDRSPDAVPMLA